MTFPTTPPASPIGGFPSSSELGLRRVFVHKPDIDVIRLPLNAKFEPFPETLKRLKAASEALRASGRSILDRKP